MSNRNNIRLQSRRRSDLQRTLQKLPDLFLCEPAVMQSVYWYPARPEEPQFVHCHASVADKSHVTGRPSLALSGGGTALTKEQAMAKVIGESVERYCSDFYDPKDLETAPYRDVRERATDPTRFVQFLPEQYQSPNFIFKPLTEESVLSWARGFSLTRGGPTLVPASLVYIPFQALTPDDAFEMAPVSGYACGNTIEEAIFGAILEVIERDSFMVFWYNWLPVPAIDLRTLRSREAVETLERFRTAPVRLHCANITTDTGIPAALAVMTSRHPGWPAAVVALAADLDAERAAARALQELSSNFLLVRMLLEQRAKPIPRMPQEVIDQEDHALFYCSPERLPHLDTVLRPRSVMSVRDIHSRPFDDLKAGIEFCVKRLEGLGLEVIVVDLTPAHVERLGFKVVKVLIPGAQPIDFGPQWKHLGGRRLTEVPERMGYKQAGAQPWELNMFPHPFP